MASRRQTLSATVTVNGAAQLHRRWPPAFGLPEALAAQPGGMNGPAAVAVAGRDGDLDPGTALDRGDIPAQTLRNGMFAAGLEPRQQSSRQRRSPSPFNRAGWGRERKTATHPFGRQLTRVARATHAVAFRIADGKTVEHITATIPATPAHNTTCSDPPRYTRESSAMSTRAVPPEPLALACWSSATGPRRHLTRNRRHLSLQAGASSRMRTYSHRASLAIEVR